ncbi:MAG: FAD-dependent oxidoreductase [Phormidesmis priestleyi Ana]|uniref:FAD-dependent oxidoreductase n=1 Tax=Phormidesmis priestleyi Ana TaxID=1666911 RepID=A0A0P8DCS6_9CYAN|nr:MAG: FAD-dependent oxidoreductase [Phormidesmis priestleyi Ana]
MNSIVIVGSGPAGAATALLLAQRGIRVTLLEKETAFERVFRGEGLMPAGLDALYQMGLKETFESIPSRPLTSWDFYVGGQRRMRVQEPGPLLPQGEGLGMRASVIPTADTSSTRTSLKPNSLATQIIDQGALLRAMVEKAQQLPNFEFYAGWQVSDLLRDESGAVVGVRAACEGEQRDFWADGAIACDGRYSRLRKLAGLQINQSPAQFDVLWFKLPAPPSFNQQAVSQTPSSPTPFIACLQADRQFALYPSWDGRLQIGWIVEKSAHQAGGLAALKQKDWIEEFSQALPPELAQHFRDRRGELEGPIYLDVQVGCCEQWSIPGLLLIGDAAHPMAPNRAQGINMALRDAIVVANHFAALAPESGADSHAVFHKLFQDIQAARQPEIEAVQAMQLSEWRKVAFISQPGLPYWGFKAVISLLGRFGFVQNIWLHEQKGLREGVLPVRLQNVR